MINRNMRGTRRVSMRARLAVAAALLAGGGAAGVVAIAGHGGAAAAQSAGYATRYHQPISATKALSSAMNGWSRTPGRSLATLSQMTPISPYADMPFHHVRLVVQRGTVALTQRAQFVVKSSNGKLALWHVNGNTKFLNVGGSTTGMAAMTGGMMMDTGKMNTVTRVLGGGDLVFVFGERENHTLKAQLILFAKPMPMAAKPTATPSMMPTPGMTGTPGMTARPRR